MARRRVPEAGLPSGLGFFFTPNGWLMEVDLSHGLTEYFGISESWRWLQRMAHGLWSLRS